MRKNVKVKPGWWPLPFARVLRSHHVDYVHHVSYMCTPYASNVGDVPEYVYPVHICEATRCLSHTWSGWGVFWEVHCITWLFSKKVWESLLFTHSLTHSLTHLFTLSLTHTLTNLLVYLLYFVKYETPLSLVLGRIWTCNLLIFGLTTKPSCLGAR